MHKKSLALIAFLISCTLHSQVLIALVLGDKLNTGKVEFGLDGGINFAQIANMESNKNERNLNLGFYFDIKMKERWYLHTGVLVKSTMGLNELSTEDLEFLGATTYDTEGIYKQKINYFLVPAMAKYRFENNLYAELGINMGLAHKAYIEFMSEIDGNSARIRESNTDMIHRFDMGLAAGAGYRLLKGLGWTLGVRYYYGLLDVYKDRSGTRNSSLFLKLNIPIGLSFEKKEQIRELKEDKKKQKELKKENRKAEKAAKKEIKDNSL